MTILVTGGAGFIGSNFIRLLLSGNDLPAVSRVVNLDKLTYAGNLENLAEIEADPRYVFVRGDICEAGDVERALAACSAKVDAIVNLAAESHVDRSIGDPAAFLRTNILGTQVLLDAARKHGIGRFIQVSTDEVYGSLGPEGAFREETPLSPNSPYSASKAAADLLVLAYRKTYGLPVSITRCSNNYGPYQFPEKLIPLMIANALEDKPLPVYGNGLNVRDWIHVEDHCRGILSVLLHGRSGEVYNFGGQGELTNLEVVRRLLALLGKPESLIRFVADRPGHDWRYAMDFSKARRELGWTPRWTFAEGIKATVEWYLAHQDWTARVRSGAYQEYYAKMYDRRQDWVKGVKGS
ncbi:MAG: dTDP-glucose 4,6-dehydratase [Patescibacteria group bacterium]